MLACSVAISPKAVEKSHSVLKSSTSWQSNALCSSGEMRAETNPSKIHQNVISGWIIVNQQMFPSTESAWMENGIIWCFLVFSWALSFGFLFLIIVCKSKPYHIKINNGCPVTEKPKSHPKLSSSLCPLLLQLQLGGGHKAGSSSWYEGRQNANKAGFNQIESSLLVIHGFKIRLLVLLSEPPAQFNPALHVVKMDDAFFNWITNSKYIEIKKGENTWIKMSDCCSAMGALNKSFWAMRTAAAAQGNMQRIIMSTNVYFPEKTTLRYLRWANGRAYSQSAACLCENVRSVCLTLNYLRLR